MRVIRHPYLWIIKGAYVEKQIKGKKGRMSIVNFGSYITGDVEIGEGVIIAPNAIISSASHQFKKGLYIKDQKTVHKKIIIGNDVFIGAGAIILGGNVIKDGAIIGAGSVLTEDHIVNSNEVWAGNPATFLKMRI